MKTKALIWFLAFFMFCSSQTGIRAEELSASWFSYSIGLPEQTKITAIASDLTGSIIMVGTNQGIFLSDDFGEHWFEQSLGLTNKDIVCMYYEPENQNFFAGTSSGGVFRYTKVASKWVSFNTNLPSKNIQAFSSSKQYLYVGTKTDGLFRVKLGSEKWVDLNFDDKNPILKKCEFRAILSLDDQSIFCATNKGLLVTDNKGENWRIVEDNSILGSSLRSIAGDPSKVGRILAGTDTKSLVESLDNGKSWKDITPSLNAAQLAPFHSIIFNPHQPKNIFVASTEKVFISLDDGRSWKQNNAGLENESITTLSFINQGASSAPCAGTESSGFFILQQARPPFKPSSLKADMKDASVVLTWKPSEKGSNLVVGYSIYKKQNKSGEIYRKIGTTEDLFYTDSQVMWSEKLSYQVSAYDDGTPSLQSNPSLEYSILVDDYPMIRILDPSDGYVSEQTRINIQGFITDQGSGIAGSSLLVTGDSGKSDQYTLSLGSDGSFNQAIVLYLGPNQLKLMATDNNNLLSEKNLVVIHKVKDPDKTPPEIITNQPPPDFMIEEDVLTVSGTIRDPESGVFEAKIWNTVGGNRLGFKILALNKEGFFLEKLPVQVGINSVTIHAIDGAGNISEKVLSGTIRKPDIIPPSLVILEPITGFVTEESTIILKGRASDDNSGISSTTVTLEYLGKVMYEKNLTLDEKGFFSETMSLMEGENLLYIVAKDQRNNQTKLSIKGNRIPKSLEIVVILQIGSKVASINGEEKLLQASPVIKKGKTYVPVRFIAEAFGANVNWVASRKEIQITYKDIYITLWLNQTIVTIESLTDFTKLPATKFLEVAPYSYGGTTMVPLRFIIEEWKTEVVWDKETQKISIRLKK